MPLINICRGSDTRLGVRLLSILLLIIMLLLFIGWQQSGKESNSAGYRSPSKSPFSCPNCNLILLNLELLRADYLGILNPQSKNTPVIDRYFANAIHFSDTVSSSGATYLSATSTATGTEAMLNTHSLDELGKRQGGGSWKLAQMIKNDGIMLVDRIPTLAQTLQSAQYRTIGINDWIHSGPWVNLDRGFDTYTETLVFGSVFEDQLETLMSSLENHKKQPFYLYFHSNALHFNFFFPMGYQPQDKTLFKDLHEFIEHEDNAIILKAKKPEMVPKNAFRAYKEQLGYIDRKLSRFFDYFDDQLKENTVLVLYSHHGIGLGRQKHLSVGKPHKAFTHVPLLIRHPKLDRPIKINTMTSLVDLSATLYDMLGIESIYPMRSHSMLPLLQQEDGAGKYARKYAYTRDLQFASIRNDRWKLIFTGGQPSELYDLSSDPEETHNLYQPDLDIVEKLLSQFHGKTVEQLEYAESLRISLENRD